MNQNSLLQVGQSLEVVARIIGQRPGNLRQWLSSGLFRGMVDGRREGRERQLHAAEAAILSLFASYLPHSGGNIKDAWARALGVVQATLPLTKSNPPMPPDVFAFEARGWVGAGSEKSSKNICQGRADLERCLKVHVAKGWPSFHVLDVSALYAEVLTGWKIAVLGAEEARRSFLSEDLPGLPEERRAMALAVFEDLEQRLAGLRPNTTADDQQWQAWRSAADAA